VAPQRLLYGEEQLGGACLEPSRHALYSCRCSSKSSICQGECQTVPKRDCRVRRQVDDDTVVMVAGASAHLWNLCPTYVN